MWCLFCFKSPAFLPFRGRLIELCVHNQKHECARAMLCVTSVGLNASLLYPGLVRACESVFAFIEVCYAKENKSD